MLRALGYRLRGRKVQGTLFFVLLLLVLALFQLSKDQSVRIRLDDRSSTGLLVTTPDDKVHPVHYLPLLWQGNGSIALGLGDAVPIKTGISPGSQQGLSHVVQNPVYDDMVYITNEIRPGSVWTGRLGRGHTGLELGIFGQNPSNGDLPAHSLVTRDGRHLIVANYGSPTLTVFSIESAGRLRQVQTIRLPRPQGVDPDTPSHPHQISQHPTSSVFYVTDLGWAAVYMLQASQRAEGLLEVGQQFDARAYGDGPRNSAIATNGRTLYLSFQFSSSVIGIPLDRRYRLQPPTVPAVATLPESVFEDGAVAPAGHPAHSSSDIILINDTLFVANRHVKGPYPAYTGGNEDTIAVFQVKSSTIVPKGHLSTGCWKPREMTRIKGDRKDYLAVTCNGVFAQGGGVVFVDVSDPASVLARWDSGKLTATGIVALSADFSI